MNIKPKVKPKEEVESDGRLFVHSKPLLVGTELLCIPTNTMYTVAHLAKWLADEEQFCIMLRPKLGFDDQVYAVAFEDLLDEEVWLVLGL